MLKHDGNKVKPFKLIQPPSGGCVLKPSVVYTCEVSDTQPPSGGCVLKQYSPCLPCGYKGPAAFGRLCVETLNFKRKCIIFNQPPSGGCVLKRGVWVTTLVILMPAAFGRLCVETQIIYSTTLIYIRQPPSGGCVLKP